MNNIIKLFIKNSMYDIDMIRINNFYSIILKGKAHAGQPVKGDGHLQEIDWMVEEVDGPWGEKGQPT